MGSGDLSIGSGGGRSGGSGREGETALSGRGERVKVLGSGSVSFTLILNSPFSDAEEELSPPVYTRESYREAVVCPCTNISVVLVNTLSPSVTSLRGMERATGIE